MIICREQTETLSTKNGRFCNNSEIDTLISKPLSVENKPKLSQLAVPLMYPRVFILVFFRLEAISCGCYPLCPNRLVYPEILSSKLILDYFNAISQVIETGY